jgi:hypothetical protein
MADLPGAQPNLAPGEVHPTPGGETDSGGAPILHGAEPHASEMEGAPAPASAAPAPTPEEAAAAEKVLAQKIRDKRYKGGGRDAIYARRDGMTLEERQALEEHDPESAAMLAAQAGGQEEEEETGAAPAAAAPKAVPGTPAAPIAPNGRTYKLTIYGQEQLVPEEQILQAGIRELQTGAAADVRMRDAATYEARLNSWRDQLQTYADELARTASPAQAQPGPAGTPAPTTGVAGQVDETKLRQALDALARGDTGDSTKLMNELITEAATKAARSVQPAPAPAPSRTHDVPRFQQSAAPVSWDDAQREKANKVFNDEFASFTDAQYEAAKATVSDAMNDPANVGKDLATIVRTACRATARFVPATAQPAPAPAPPQVLSGTDTELAGRRVLKARLPMTPPPASGRAPSGAPEVRFPNNSEYVQSLRSRSGSNSTRG